MANFISEKSEIDKLSLDKEYSLQRVHKSLNLSAKLKSKPEDFIVAENILVDFKGEGEHCWLYIKKRNCNTDWVAQKLASYCGVKKMAVSYAGLKDRNAITSQWFSVQLPGKPTPDWGGFESDEGGESIRVLACHRHNKKLQRGALKSNTFAITLRELSNAGDETFLLLQQRCQLIAQQGVPNYFGPQRFGRNHNNLDQAIKLFTKPGFRLPRQKRSMYLSAARSWMFNCIVSARISLDLWNKRLPGDVFMLAGKSACFRDELEDAGSSGIDQRLELGEIHPTAVLWGEGDTMVTSDAAELEASIIDQFPVYRDGLIAARLQAQRRACRLIPGEMQGHRQEDDLVVSFSLPAGSYATVVLAEIFSELIEPV